MTSPPFPGETDEISEVADWMELMVLSTGQPYKRGNLTMTLQREGSTISSADVIDELQQRATLMGQSWPFDLDAANSVLSLKPNPTSQSLYTFMAALGLRVNVDSEGRQLFEECVTELSRVLTGRAAMRIGFPRKPPIAVSFKQAIEDYCDASHERAGLFNPPEADDNDLGLDVATWSPFKDGRGGYLHFIGQCATGANYVDKLADLNVEIWRDHLSWAVAPVKFLAIPFVVPREYFRRTSKEAGLVLDRPRLMELADRVAVPPAMEARMTTYTDALYP